MSADGSVTFTWGDGDHRFRLAIGQLRELQEKCNAGPREILDRLMGSRWRLEDLIETIRLGLIGGGMEPVAARILVQRYCEERPLMESQRPATAILMAAVIGLPEEPVGKKPGEGAATETADSSSPPSTEPAPQ